MKCWISNGFHRESQFRLPQASLCKVFLKYFWPPEVSLFWKDRSGSEPSGWEPGDSLMHTSSLQVFCNPKLRLLSWTSFGRCYPFWGLRILWNLPRLLIKSPWPLPVNPFPPTHHFYRSWFSFGSISHIHTLLSVPSSSSYKKDATFTWHYKVYKVHLHIISLSSNKFMPSWLPNKSLFLLYYSSYANVS